METIIAEQHNWETKLKKYELLCQKRIYNYQSANFNNERAKQYEESTKEEREWASKARGKLNWS